MIFDTHAHYDDEAFEEDRSAPFFHERRGVGCVNDPARQPGFGGTLELIKAYPFCVWRRGSSRRCRNYDTGYSG